jgi:hypothetical protein
MKKTNFFIFIFVLTLLVSSVSATTIELKTNSVLDDLTYTYTAKTNLILSSLEVVSGEIYLDGEDFCSSDYVNDFTTSRDCPSSGGGSSSSSNTITKKDCNITITPNNLEMTKQELKINFLSNDISPFLFNFGLTSSNFTFPQKFRLSQINSPLFYNKTNFDLTIATIENNLKGDLILKLTSARCNDIQIPINVNIFIDENELILDEQIKPEERNLDEDSSSNSNNEFQTDYTNVSNISPEKFEKETNFFNNKIAYSLYSVIGILILTSIGYLISLKRRITKKLTFINDNSTQTVTKKEETLEELYEKHK